MSRDCSSGKEYSQELLRRSRKRLKKRFIEKRQPYQSKPVSVETVDPNRTRPKIVICCYSLDRMLCCAAIHISGEKHWDKRWGLFWFTKRYYELRNKIFIDSSVCNSNRSFLITARIAGVEVNLHRPCVLAGNWYHWVWILTIVNRGEWLWSSANIEGPNKDNKI